MALSDLRMAFYNFGNCGEIGISPPFNVYILWSQPRVSLRTFLQLSEGKKRFWLHVTNRDWALLYYNVKETAVSSFERKKLSVYNDP